MVQSLPVLTKSDQIRPQCGLVSLCKKYHLFGSVWFQLFKKHFEFSPISVLLFETLKFIISDEMYKHSFIIIYYPVI